MRFCIIIPCFNEAKRFSPSGFKAYYETRPDISFCFINDGSTDNTLSFLNSLARGRDDRISVISLPSNMGKAEAVKTGILSALRVSQPDFVGFMDADLATPFSEIDDLVSCCIESPDAAVVFGSRIKRSGANISRSPIRHYLGRVFAAATRIFLGIQAYDTQCGAKLIRASIAAEIFREPFISRWLFDVELFLRVAALTYVSGKSFIEFPLGEWTEKGNSRLGVKDAFVIILDFISIFFKYSRVSRSKRALFYTVSGR